MLSYIFSIMYRLYARRNNGNCNREEVVYIDRFKAELSFYMYVQRLCVTRGEE